MREIVFRGKITEPCKYQGQWLEGFYGEGDGLPLIAIQQKTHFNGLKGFFCDPLTVGQYTGLTDKNGTRIFEGDILEGDLEDNLDPGAKWRSVVVWGKFGWNCKGGHVSLPIDEFDIKEGEVIGNIHDNPELMEVNDG